MRRMGSSPLARGLRSGFGRTAEEVRIIPARAGFTAYVCVDGGWHADHPRSRGVYSALCLVMARSVGSSPLARGLLEKVRKAVSDVRIIPARAGFT